MPEDEIERLRERLEALTYVPKKRHKTKPTKGSQRRRLDTKKREGEKKAQRSKKVQW